MLYYGYCKYGREVRMTKDMTVGRPMPILVHFTIPLVLGNLFQLTYNAADSIIVGRYVGKEALAAVGICNPIITLMILFLNGLSIGAGILMGMQYGAEDHELLKRQISTTTWFGIMLSTVFSIVCIVFAKPLLRLLQVEAQILDLTCEYFRIIFAGLVFTFLYNCFSAILRALGDSKTPLFFLIVSAVLNIAGDLIFVIYFRAGSKGCAIATVISEAFSCLLCIFYIQLKVPILRLGRKWFCFDKSLLKKTIAYGWTSAMQQATVQLGKLGIQAIVNTMGVSVAAAFTAVNRIDDFAYTPQQNIGHAMTAFMAQNLGAGKKKRMKEGFLCGMKLELFYGLFIMCICLFLARPIMLLFGKDETVIAHGTAYLRLIAVMYLLPSLTNGIQGYFRGIGDLKVTLLSSTVNMALRLLAALPLVFVFKMQMEALPLSYLAGWIAMLLTELPLLIKNYRSQK